MGTASTEWSHVHEDGRLFSHPVGTVCNDPGWPDRLDQWVGQWSGSQPGPLERENRADWNGQPMQPEQAEPMLRWFDYAHLPEHLQAISANFANLARSLCARLPRSPERTVALRKLLESKDAAVRAAVD